MPTLMNTRYSEKQITKILAALKPIATGEPGRHILAFAMPWKGDTIATNGRILARVHGLTFAEPPVLNPKALRAIGTPNHGTFRPQINSWSDLAKHDLSQNVPDMDRVIPYKTPDAPPVTAELNDFIARKDARDAQAKALADAVKAAKAAWLSPTTAELNATHDAYQKALADQSAYEAETPDSMPLTIAGQTAHFNPRWIALAMKVFAAASPGEPIIGQLQDDRAPILLYTRNATVVIALMRVS